jgi:hypothetical protein
MRKSIFFWLLSVSLSTHVLFGQGFQEVSTSMGINMRNTGNSVLGVGMSFYDFDGDGWDDLTYCSSNDSLVMYRNLGGTGFERIEIFPFTHDSKMATWADYDNDGDADLLWTKRSGTSRLFRNDGNWIFADVTTNLNIVQNGLTHCYGSSWADYDRDGWLDVQISTYSTLGNSRNFLLHNNQDGTFTDLSVDAGVADLGSLTFQSAWQDFNNDQWPDLYVINDNNTSNHLYINNQDGTFSDITTTAGVGTFVQSMNIGITDYDHDQDWDIYVTDAMSPNFLWTNNGDLTFTNTSASANLEVNSFCWAGTWVDYDHDTYDDIYVCTATNVLNQDFFYRNMGDGTFEDAAVESINTSQLFTYAAGRGDFNNDGIWDLSVTCTGDTSYLLLQGLPTDNHWVKVSLEGTHSNRDAIGTQLDYYINGVQHMQYTRCGEGYLTQHSGTQILSLGNAEVIDSLIITWPRGLVEKLYNVPADQWIQLVEGQYTQAQIQATSSLWCGEPLVLSVTGYESVLWGDSSTADSLWITAPGTFTVVVTDSNGYVFQDSIVIASGANIAYELNIEQPVCYENNVGSCQFDVEENTQVIWSDQLTANARDQLAPGWYYYTIEAPQSCSIIDSLEIISAWPLEYALFTDSVTCFGEANGEAWIDISSSADSIHWSNGQFGELLTNVVAGSYPFTIYYTSTCTAIDTAIIHEPTLLTTLATTTDVLCHGEATGTIALTITGGIAPYAIDYFGLDPNALLAGEYSAMVTDLNNCSANIAYTILEPNALSILEATLENANNGANGSITLSVTGGTPPYQYQWNNGDEDEFNDALGQGTYTVEIEDAAGCTITATYSIVDVSISEHPSDEILVAPNPANDRIIIRFLNKPQGRWFILNAAGETTYHSNNSGDQTLNISNWASGLYVVCYYSGGSWKHYRLMVE